MHEVESLLRRNGVVALATIDNPERALPLADALTGGGLTVVEVVLRTPESLRSIRAITSATREMNVLAGTVLTLEDADSAVESGAIGLVSPGFSAEVSRWATEHGVLYIPGVATATEITTALDHGHQLLKFFPASILGGLPGLSALNAPFSHRGVSFVMTGGLAFGDLHEALAAPFVAAVGGSWIAPRDLVDKGSWDVISQHAREASAVVADVRGGQSVR